MVDGKKLIHISLILIGIFFYNCLSIAMEKPYHHLPDGTFRNPEGSPQRDPNFKWSYKIFNQEKKKLNMTIENHPPHQCIIHSRQCNTTINNRF